MNTLFILLVLCCIISKGFRKNTGDFFIWVGNTLKGEDS